jgi:hypothetical protein
MSKEQTFRSEDKAFLPLRKRQFSLLCETDAKPIEPARQDQKGL